MTKKLKQLCCCRETGLKPSCKIYKKVTRFHHFKIWSLLPIPYLGIWRNHQSELYLHQVSISTPFYEQLCHTKVFRAASLCLQIIWVWRNKIGKKVACKMLVKLTNVLKKPSRKQIFQKTTISLKVICNFSIIIFLQTFSKENNRIIFNDYPYSSFYKIR